ncbi:Hypp1979 [Branchiostoma lanceolatum]|uniref:Hypp1979 protein n=1 Tax=Branchiostoma lanceolatum TaxID=7740 RepID=A0A8J9ZMI8_BRALA|nr:Hypp1979 [Branchiostoma lanceolatum]
MEKKMKTSRDILRVFLCGAHSTGKTTLLTDLGKAVRIHGEPEVARKVIKDMGLTREHLDYKKNPKAFEDLQLKILDAQCETERRNAEAGRDYIADRGIDPVVYADVCLGEDAKQRLLGSHQAKECIERYKTSLVFVLTPHQECIKDDGFRMMGTLEELQRYTIAMTTILHENDIPFTLIRDLDRQKRVQIVREKILEMRPDLGAEGCDDN